MLLMILRQLLLVLKLLHRIALWGQRLHLGHVKTMLEDRMHALLHPRVSTRRGLVALD